MEIVVDYREFNSILPRILAEMGVHIRKATLDVGDYLVGGQTLIERKTSKDFIVSIIDKRIFDQCLRLSNSPFYPVLLIEGNLYENRPGSEAQNIEGTLLSIACSWHIPIIYSDGARKSCQTLIKIGGQKTHKRRFRQFEKANPVNHSDPRMGFLMGIPGIGQKKASILLDRYKTLDAVLKAPAHQLAATPGLGSACANKMTRFLTGA